MTQEGLPREEAQQAYVSPRGGPEPGVQHSESVITPEFNSLTAVQTASIKEIARTLGKQAAMLIFFVGDGSNTVMLLQDGQVSG